MVFIKWCVFWFTCRKTSLSDKNLFASLLLDNNVRWLEAAICAPALQSSASTTCMIGIINRRYILQHPCLSLMELSLSIQLREPLTHVTAHNSTAYRHTSETTLMSRHSHILDSIRHDGYRREVPFNRSKTGPTRHPFPHHAPFIHAHTFLLAIIEEGSSNTRLRIQVC